LYVALSFVSCRARGFEKGYVISYHFESDLATRLQRALNTNSDFLFQMVDRRDRGPAVDQEWRNMKFRMGPNAAVECTRNVYAFSKEAKESAQDRSSDAQRCRQAVYHFVRPPGGFVDRQSWALVSSSLGYQLSCCNTSFDKMLHLSFSKSLF
jgi:hypothetical protein